ncbi:cyclase family protein [Marinoscillum furvescens]|uniref:Kynurenine formamidase n=1 Tax=Marinoscillum furvescens DSM 4134 TaxID=1122208 RepID=A0A3D9L2I7_MARFU|nr:cyclase family protein [Marinoscillum furvescens]RED98951.1 kynurenine formamidase [Marinoscillum furvescens DSM 4134]
MKNPLLLLVFVLLLSPLRAQLSNDRQLAKALPTLMNWGQWGPDDQLGTLNYLTDSLVILAAQEIQTGHTISLARTTSITDQHVMQGTYEAYKETHGLRDFVGAVWHGFELTHLDALNHVFADSGRLYNGYDLVEGLSKLSIDKVAAHGIVGRAVLVDVARYLPEGVHPGMPIYPHHLDQVLEKQNTMLRSGDVLMVRTGLGRSNSRTLRAGLHPSCLLWIKDNQVSMLGSDGDSDAYPVEGFQKYSNAFHTVGIPYLGLPLLDNAELEALSEYCFSQRRYTFFITIAPWRINGASSSPINPIAIF